MGNKPQGQNFIEFLLTAALVAIAIIAAIIFLGNRLTPVISNLNNNNSSQTQTK